jgi:AcrR family transcriptional regulator
MGRATRRDGILDAAARVVRRDGAALLTLDAVAAAAGVSKGGLLYHFGTKDDLVSGLVDRLLARFDERVAAATNGDDGSFVAAYVEASVNDDVDDFATAAALVAAIALSPSLLGPLRARYAQWSRALAASCSDKTTALIVRLALDGLWFADLLELAPPSRSERQALARALVAQATAATKTKTKTTKKTSAAKPPAKNKKKKETA